MTIFLDLIQTPSVVLPVFVVVLLLSAFVVMVVVTLRRDDNDRSLSRQEQARMKRQEERLTQFAKTGELARPVQRIDTLLRGSSDAEPAWLRRLLTKYHLRLERNAEGDPARLVDTRYDGLANNVVELEPQAMTMVGLDKWEKVTKSAHFAVRKRAIRAGLQKPRPQPGNPGKARHNEVSDVFN